MLNITLIEKNLLQFIRQDRFTQLTIDRTLIHLGDIEQDVEVPFTLAGASLCRGYASQIALDVRDIPSNIGDVISFIETHVLGQTFENEHGTLTATGETELTLGAFFPLNIMSLAILLEEGIESAFNYNKQVVRS